MKKLKYIPILSIIFLLSCNSNIYVYKINQKTKYKKNEFIYNLPQTTIRIQIELTTVTKQKGPFNQFAEKYLGEKKTISADSREMKITNINFVGYPSIDTSQFYAVRLKKSKSFPQFNFTEQGFLTGINTENNDFKNTENNNIQFFINNESVTSLNYADYTVKPNLETKYDTTFREIYKDSAFVKIPVIKQATVNKSVEDQAKELADQIFSLRDDRNALLKAENDGGKIPDSKTFELMFNGLNNLEKDYMSLFVGKISETKKYYQIDFTPIKSDSSTNDTLFRFSEKYGILPTESKTGQPIIISITSKRKTENLNKSVLQKQKKSAKGLAYRIADDAFVEIFIDTKKIAQTKMKIAQFGNVMRLSNNLIDKKTKIEFFTEYGSLKSISGKP